MAYMHAARAGVHASELEVVCASGRAGRLVCRRDQYLKTLCPSIGACVCTCVRSAPRVWCRAVPYCDTVGKCGYLKQRSALTRFGGWLRCLIDELQGIDRMAMAYIVTANLKQKGVLICFGVWPRCFVNKLQEPLPFSPEPCWRSLCVIETSLCARPCRHA